MFQYIIIVTFEICARNTMFEFFIFFFIFQISILLRNFFRCSKLIWNATITTFLWTKINSKQYFVKRLKHAIIRERLEIISRMQILRFIKLKISMKRKSFKMTNKFIFFVQNTNFEFLHANWMQWINFMY